MQLHCEFAWSESRWHWLFGTVPCFFVTPYISYVTKKEWSMTKAWKLNLHITRNCKFTSMDKAENALFLSDINLLKPTVYMIHQQV
jgi:hypothetical protein